MKTFRIDCAADILIDIAVIVYNRKHVDKRRCRIVNFCFVKQPNRLFLLEFDCVLSAHGAQVCHFSAIFGGKRKRKKEIWLVKA